jgi:hypothetical protein
MKKDKSWCGLFFAMAALAIASSLAVSQIATIVPTMVKFSGTVAGAPSRVVGIPFAFYKDQQGGAPLWMETQSVSLDGSGRCNAQLGATLPAGLPKDLFASGHGTIASGHPTTRMWVVSRSKQRQRQCRVEYVMRWAKFTELTMPPRIFFTKKLMEIYVNSRLHGRCRP